MTEQLRGLRQRNTVAGNSQNPTIKSEVRNEPSVPVRMKMEGHHEGVLLDRVTTKTDPHVVAGGKISRGTVILKEKPVLTLVDLSGYLPQNGEGRLVERPCFGCGSPNATYKCKCYLSLCAKICPKLDNHSEWECPYIVRIRKDPILRPPRPSRKGSNRLHVLDTMMLRFHLLSEKNEVLYHGMLQLRNHPRVVSLKQNNTVYQKLAATIDSWAWLSTRFCSLYDKKYGNLRQDVLAITLVMPTSPQTASPYLSFLYPTLTTWMTHSCVPNTDFVISGVNNEVVLVAANGIQEHERIEVNLWPIQFFTTSQRRAFLEKLQIKCNCKRCQDPTELNTFIGALHCVKVIGREYCDGFYSPISSDFGVDWKCGKCSDKISAESAKNVTTLYLDWPARSFRTLDDIFNFLDYLGQVCHSTHSITLRTHQLVTQALAPSIFLCDTDEVVERLRLRELYSSTKALLWFYYSMKLVFHHNTAYVLMLHTVSEFYLQRQLISKQLKRAKNWRADRAKDLLRSSERLDLCKRVFSVYDSIPKYAEYLAYVKKMQTFLQFLGTEVYGQAEREQSVKMEANKNGNRKRKKLSTPVHVKHDTSRY